RGSGARTPADDPRPSRPPGNRWSNPGKVSPRRVSSTLQAEVSTCRKPRWERAARHQPLRDNGGMQLRVALAQVDPTVGDLPGNAALIRGWTRKAADAGAQLVAFPEMVLTGYPVEDLVFRESFVAASRRTLERLAADLATDGLGDLAVAVGYLDADGPARLGADAAP